MLLWSLSYQVQAVPFPFTDHMLVSFDVNLALIQNQSPTYHFHIPVAVAQKVEWVVH